MKCRIYVACLSSYNNGYLHGRWIDCNLGVEHVHEQVKEMLAEGQAALLQEGIREVCEEWAIHDYDFNGYRKIEEYSSIEECCFIAECFQLDYPQAVIEYIIENFVDFYAKRNATIEEVKDLLQERYVGVYESLGDYAEQYCDECLDMKNVPTQIQGFIDYDAMGRDWEIGGDIVSIDRGYKEVYILNNY